MKRLIKKCKQEIMVNDETGIPIVDTEIINKLRNEVINDINNVNISNMILLNQLDEADIRHDKCPNCKHGSLKRKEGFKICPSCGTIYKMFNGNGYVVVG